jgi:transcriptional regulator with AAA-type ATPase domain
LLERDFSNAIASVRVRHMALLSKAASTQTLSSIPHTRAAATQTDAVVISSVTAAQARDQEARKMHARDMHTREQIQALTAENRRLRSVLDEFTRV